MGVGGGWEAEGRERAAVCLAKLKKNHSVHVRTRRLLRAVLHTTRSLISAPQWHHTPVVDCHEFTWSTYES